MAEPYITEKQIIPLEFQGRTYDFVEQVDYPNGGYTRFFQREDEAVAVDYDICKCSGKKDVFPYSLITDKQNQYMKSHLKLYRLLAQDLVRQGKQKQEKDEEEGQTTPGYKKLYDRGQTTDSSPLEFLFEEKFSNAYGMSALEYLVKEHCISDETGNQYFLDYLVNTQNGQIAVEENGVTYHHPQIIGEEKYRKQLRKQNACTRAGIKLYRFSTEDCRFADRIEDDIRSYFGNDDSLFLKNGIVLERKLELYEHQKDTLLDMEKKRSEGVRSFLIVFPTASGKSRIVEEDIRIYAQNHSNHMGLKDFKALILAPNSNIIDDWKDRVGSTLSAYKDAIDIHTYSYMTRHYQEIDPEKYAYIVVDEAHHAVAPVLKRVIQHFRPGFLVGLTATDQRPDKKRLEEVFGNYETGLSLIDAMEQGIVAQANVFRIETNLDLSKVRFNGKDYVNADLEKSIRVTSRNELIVDVLKEYFCQEEMEKRQGVIFCVNTRHAKEMERLMMEAGISARAYTSKEKHPEQIMADFKNHKIRFLCSCSMVSEGWDYPELGILVMARPTMSKVLYLQQIGRGLRRTDAKNNVFIIDVVDEYGTMAKPCSMHAIFSNSMYVPFGNITKRDYHVGEMIEIGGLHERVEKIVPVDVETFEDKYGDYLNQEQLAREFFMSTGSIISWIKKKKIEPSTVIPFGSRKIYLFSPENVQAIRSRYQIAEHNDDTIREDFFAFLEERDYSLSYKMPFLLSLLDHMNQVGDAKIKDVLDDYIAFYQDRIDRGLTVDRATCPYNRDTLKDEKKIQSSMLTNPFEKFERKRFLYYSKNLGMISMNHALFSKLTREDYDKIRKQMREDLENYYRGLESD